jgi:hypothetical protein
MISNTVVFVGFKVCYIFHICMLMYAGTWKFMYVHACNIPICT